MDSVAVLSTQNKWFFDFSAAFLDLKILDDPGAISTFRAIRVGLYNVLQTHRSTTKWITMERLSSEYMLTICW